MGDQNYMEEIEKEMFREGFLKLNHDQAEEATAAIRGFIIDLAFNNWDGEPLGYGG